MSLFKDCFILKMGHFMHILQTPFYNRAQWQLVTFPQSHSSGVKLYEPECSWDLPTTSSVSCSQFPDLQTLVSSFVEWE